MRLVIGDVHGYYDALLKLLELAAPSDSSSIFLLGDLIDRGPQSKEVINWVRTNNVNLVMGNHEQMLLQVLRWTGGEELSEREKELAMSWTIPRNGGRQTIQSFGFTDLEHFLNESSEYLKEIKQWLESIPLWQELDRFILVHAGIDPNYPMEAQSEEALLWDRDWFFSLKTPPIPGKTLIVGHTQTWSLRHQIDDFRPGDIVAGKSWINLDTGSRLPEFGWLTGLDLDSMKAIQVNVISLESRSFHLAKRVKSLS